MRRFAAFLAALALLVTGIAISPGKASAETQWGTWQEYGGHWYVQLDGLSWQDAESWAQQGGGYLATVNDADEQEWLHATFVGDQLAIGLSDSQEPDTWVWANGEDSAYRDWCEGEPNDAQGGEFYAAINWEPDGCWNDLPETWSSIIEAAAPFAFLSIDATVSHYLGGEWEHQVSIAVNCDGYDGWEVWMDFPGSVANAIGPVAPGTFCWLDVSYWPDAGWNAGWDPPSFTPGAEVVLDRGSNLVAVDIPRVWGGEVGWPPEEDSWTWHDMQLTVNTVNLNAKGGIEVEGTAWCPDAAALADELSGNLYHNVQWSALQYVGRKTVIHAGYESAIADLCWQADKPGHGPFNWKTRYPNGNVQYVYGWDGRFASGTIHVEATASAEMISISQNFDPNGFHPFEGGAVVPYDASCQDNNGDGWCVEHHAWMGFAGKDLKTTRVK